MESSTLFVLYHDYLLSQGIKEQQIITINFEDVNNEHLTEYRALYHEIETRLVPDQMNYILLDEIQHVKQFEKAVDSLFIKKNVDLYITGSNAYFMSGELATLLTGRYVELSILPFSFQEYCQGLKLFDFHQDTTTTQKYQSYISEGSFPYTLQFKGKKDDIYEYMNGIYSSILLKDIVARYHIKDVMVLERIIKFIFDNIGSLLSMRSIANVLTSNGYKVDQKTVEKYCQALMDSLLIYQAKRFNVKGKMILSTLEKYYVTDLGLRYFLLGNKGSDQGHMLENVIYLELKRRYRNVYVGNLHNKEIDFVVETKQGNGYYQVALSVLDEHTLERELSPLLEVRDHYPKYLLTLDELGANSSYEGIIQLNALDWLLKKDS